MVAQKVTRDVELRPGVLDRVALDDFAAIKRPKAETTLELQALTEQLAGCQVFDVLMDGALVGRYALKVNRWAFGTEADLRAAVGRLPGVNLTATLLPIIERAQLRAAGINAVKIETRRKVLVGRLLAQGYELCSYTLRKRIAA